MLERGHPGVNFPSVELSRLLEVTVRLQWRAGARRRRVRLPCRVRACGRHCRGILATCVKRSFRSWTEVDPRRGETQCRQQNSLLGERDDLPLARVRRSAQLDAQRVNEATQAETANCPSHRQHDNRLMNEYASLPTPSEQMVPNTFVVTKNTQETERALLRDAT